MSEENQHTDLTANFTDEKEPSSLKLIFALGIAGFLSGILLVSAYLYTLPMIEANKAAALQKAIFKVLPGCHSFQSLALIDGELIEESELGEVSGKQQKKGEAPKKIFAGFDDQGKFIGFAIPGSEPGFQDIIGAIYGYDATKNMIIGFEVLESKETPGLGDKIFKDPDFQSNFTSLETEPDILAVKKGKKVNPNEVETITGATISSKAVVRLLNKSLKEWKLPVSEYLRKNNMNLTNNLKK